LRDVIELPPRSTRFDYCPTSGWINAYRPHTGEIDYQAIFTDRQSSDVMATSSKRYLQAFGLGEQQGLDNIGLIVWLSDSGRTSVDHPIEELAPVFVAGAAWLQHVSIESISEYFEVRHASIFGVVHCEPLVVRLQVDCSSEVQASNERLNIVLNAFA
jgi:hypothetical protein